MRAFYSGLLSCLLMSQLLTTKAHADSAEQCKEARKLVTEGSGSTRDKQELLRVYRKAISLCPKFLEAHYNLGLVLLELGNLGESKAAFRAALDVKEHVQSYVALGNIAYLSGDKRAAADYYQKAVQLDGKSYQAHLGLGVAYEAQARLEEAKKALTRAREINPDDWAAHYNLGVVELRLGNATQAGVMLNEALKRNRDRPEIYRELGRVAVMSANLADAEGSLTKATLLDPKNVDSWADLGAVRERMGKYRDAEDALARALALKADHVPALVSMGIVKVKRGDAAAGIELLQKAAGLDPRSSEAYSALGWAYLGVEDLENAEKALATALNLDESSAFAHNNYGVLLQLKGDEAAAAEQFKRAKQLSPELKAATTNLQRINE